MCVSSNLATSIQCLFEMGVGTVCLHQTGSGWIFAALLCSFPPPHSFSFSISHIVAELAKNIFWCCREKCKSPSSLPSSSSGQFGARTQCTIENSVVVVVMVVKMMTVMRRKRRKNHVPRVTKGAASKARTKREREREREREESPVSAQCRCECACVVIAFQATHSFSLYQSAKHIHHTDTATAWHTHFITVFRIKLSPVDCT